MSQIPICSGSWSESQLASYHGPALRRKAVFQRLPDAPEAGSDILPTCKYAARSGGERPA